MNVASLVEMLNVPVAVPGSSAQVSAALPETFKDSLFVACQKSSDLKIANLAITDTTQPQKTAFVSGQAPGIQPQQTTTTPSPVSPVQDSQPAPTPLPSLLPPAPQPSLEQSATVPTQLLQPVPTPPAKEAVLPVAKAAIGRPASVKLSPSHVLKAPSVSTSIAQVSLPAPKVSIVVASVLQSAPVPQVQAPPVTTTASSSVNSVPANVLAHTAPVATVPAAASSSSPAFHTGANAAADTVSVAASEVAPQSEGSRAGTIATLPVAKVASSPSSNPSVNPPPAVPAGVREAVPPVQASVTPASATTGPVAPSVPEIALDTVAKPDAAAALPIEPRTKTVAEVTPRSMTAPVPFVLKNPAVTVAPLPVMHDAGNPSATQDPAPKASLPPTIKAEPPAASPPPPIKMEPSAASPSATIKVDPPATAASPDSGIGSPDAPIVPPLAAIQPPLVIAPAITPAVIPVTAGDGKSVTVKAVDDTAGLKQHAPPSSEQSGLPANSQGSLPTGEQSPGGSPQQGQSGTPAPANLVTHTTAAAVDSPPSAPVAGAPQAIASTATSAGHAAKAPEPPTSAASALPQPAPVVNTARLMQTVGQSEMRVGMRSSDFGNISISTSATRDAISAQISLDHGELARALAAHVPEMQARLGGNQAMDVRIDMNGQATGQGSTTSSGMSTASGEGSRGEQQPRSNAGPAQQNEKVSVTATAAMPHAEAALNARLDVRV